MKSNYAKISNKRWFDMTPREQEAELKELDKPIQPSQFKPLTKKQRLIWERMQSSKPNGSIVIRKRRADVVIRLDDDLIQRANAYAKNNRTNLPKMIDRGLRGLLAFAR